MINFILKNAWVVWLGFSLGVAGIFWYMWQFWMILIPVCFLVQVANSRN